MMTLQNFNLDDFLNNYWQQKPLLIRNALPDFQSPLTPDELAGLACEDEIESRLVIGADKDWQLISGPLDDQHFEQLPEKNWTLLVQAVDHWVPEVAELIEYFRFIPNWRIDDVMVSYASEGGSVGPHYDNYDVFLVQGLGQRHWRIGQYCEEGCELQDTDQLKLLKDFNCSGEWTLNPGDILYVPPRCAHWGLGVNGEYGDDCMTYSIGFRAPSHAELLSHFCDEQLSHISEQQRYTDKSLQQLSNPGEVSQQALDQIHSTLQDLISDKEKLHEWFGRYMTEPKYPHLHDEESAVFTVKALNKLLAEHDQLHRNPASRFAFINQPDHCILFIDGQSHICKGETVNLAQFLCQSPQFEAEDISKAISNQYNKQLILELINQGCLFFDEADQKHE